MEVELTFLTRMTISCFHFFLLFQKGTQPAPLYRFITLYCFGSFKYNRTLKCGSEGFPEIAGPQKKVRFAPAKKSMERYRFWLRGSQKFP